MSGIENEMIRVVLNNMRCAVAAKCHILSQKAFRTTEGSVRGNLLLRNTDYVQDAVVDYISFSVRKPNKAK